MAGKDCFQVELPGQWIRNTGIIRFSGMFNVILWGKEAEEEEEEVYTDNILYKKYSTKALLNYFVPKRLAVGVTGIEVRL